MNTKIIKLDINRKLHETITAKQGDTKSRFLLFHLLDGSVPFNLIGKSIRAYGLKPDSQEVFNDLIVNDAEKGYCTLELTNQMLATVGVVKLELMITEGKKKLTSIPFIMDVIKSINSEKSIVSTNEFTALLNGLASLNEYDNYKNEIAEARGGQTNLKKRLDGFDASLETNANKLNETISSYDRNLIEVKQRLFNPNLKNRQYIFVGDSLRDSNGRYVFKKMAYKLATNGISPCLIAKSGLKAEHWSKTNIIQNLNDFPTTDDVIKVIKGDGSECVVDICLCTNDLAKTETEVVGYLKKGIADILTVKPNVKFILTTPNRYNDTEAQNNKARNIVKKVVDDLGNVAFSDVMSEVFRTREETIPYLLDTMHPNPLGQDKIGEYKVKQLFDGSDTLTYDIEFEELIFNNTDGSKTVIRYALNFDYQEGDTFYIQKDYENKWLFSVNNNGNYVALTELITENGFSVLKPRFNKTRCAYGLLEVENVEGLINYPSGTILTLEAKNRTVTSKIKYPITVNENRLYNLLDNIKVYVVNGEVDKMDSKYSSLNGVNIKVGFYKTEGMSPSSVYLKRERETEFYLVDESNEAICNVERIVNDGVYRLRPIDWGTIRVTGILKIRNLTKLKEVIRVGEKVKIINAEHTEPIKEKSILEILDY